MRSRRQDISRKTRRKKRKRRKERKKGNAGKIFVVFLSIIIGVLVPILTYLYTARPIVYSKAKVPERFSPKNESLCFLVLMCNTGGIDARVNIVIIVEGDLAPSSDSTFTEHWRLIIELSVILFNGGRNYTTIPICVNIRNTPRAFDMSITVKIHFSFATMFGEYHTLGPTQFLYERKEGEYLLDP